VVGSARSDGGSGTDGSDDVDDGADRCVRPGGADQQADVGRVHDEVAAVGRKGSELCILTAVSLLAFLGLRHPTAMLPILVFEVLWKVLWFGIVALPHLIANDFDAVTGSFLFSMSFVIPIIAVTPWDFVWKRYVTAQGERWTRTH
jgi:uncharacterized paraquat-inducible protein A